MAISKYERSKVEELETMLEAGRLVDSRMIYSVTNRNGKYRSRIKSINEVEVTGKVLSFEELEKMAAHERKKR